MDVKCVRVLRPYDKTDDTKNVLYVDEEARYSLMKQWGEKVMVKGRRDVKDVEIQPLKPMDQNGYIARAGQKLIDEMYIEYGEEIMII